MRVKREFQTYLNVKGTHELFFVYNTSIIQFNILVRIHTTVALI